MNGAFLLSRQVATLADRHLLLEAYLPTHESATRTTLRAFCSSRTRPMLTTLTRGSLVPPNERDFPRSKRAARRESCGLRQQSARMGTAKFSSTHQRGEIMAIVTVGIDPGKERFHLSAQSRSVPRRHLSSAVNHLKERSPFAPRQTAPCPQQSVPRPPQVSLSLRVLGVH